MENMNEDNSINVIGVIKRAFEHYKANFQLFFLIGFIGSSVSLLVQCLGIYNIPNGWLVSVISLVGTVVSFWGYVALIWAVSLRYQGESISIKEAFIRAKNKLRGVVGVISLYFLIYITGLLLLIIPGLYWGTIFSLAGIIFILEECDFFDSFRKSKKLIKGHFWKVFLIYLLVNIIFLPTWLIHSAEIIVILKTFLFIIFSVLVNPFIVGLSIIIYFQLRRFQSIEKTDEQATSPKGMGCAGCLSMIGLIVVIIFLSSVWIKNLSGFFKSEKGIKYYDWIAEKVSPSIVLPGGASLERPVGFAVVKSEQGMLTYTFFGFYNQKFTSYKAFVLSRSDLDLSGDMSLDSDGELIWDSYYEYLLKQYPTTESYFKNRESEPIETLNLRNGIWFRKLFKQKTSERSKSQQIWVYDYRPYNDFVLFVSYEYIDELNLDSQQNLTQEIQRIIGEVKFSLK